MGYTWTDGELITATKLNNTGGGSYDFVITCEYDGDDLVNVALDSGSYSDVLDILQNGNVPSGILYVDNNGNGTRIGFPTSIIDLSASNMIAVAFITYSPFTDIIEILAFVINSDGSVDLD